MKPGSCRSIESAIYPDRRPIPVSIASEATRDNCDSGSHPAYHRHQGEVFSPGVLLRGEQGRLDRLNNYKRQDSCRAGGVEEFVAVHF